jgi:hypothetical protein
MKNTLQDQRGVAMLVEIILGAVIIGLGGFALYANHQAALTAAKATVSKVVTTPMPTPNGNVDNAVQSLTQSTSSETTSVDTESTAATNGGDGVSGAASDIGGSYDENSF